MPHDQETERAILGSANDRNEMILRDWFLALPDEQIKLLNDVCSGKITEIPDNVSAILVNLARVKYYELIERYYGRQVTDNLDQGTPEM